MTIGVPCADSGSHGAGGALRRIAARVSSRGAESVTRRKASRTRSASAGRPGDQSTGDLRPDLVQAEGELGDDPEVAATASEGPEQIGVLLARRPIDRSIGQHDLDLLEIVDRPPESAGQVAESASQRQPGDASQRDEPERYREPVLLGGPIHVSEQCARLDPGDPSSGVDLDGIPSRTCRASLRRRTAPGRRCCDLHLGSTARCRDRRRTAQFERRRRPMRHAQRSPGAS